MSHVCILKCIWTDSFKNTKCMNCKFHTNKIWILLKRWNRITSIRACRKLKVMLSDFIEFNLISPRYRCLIGFMEMNVLNSILFMSNRIWSMCQLFELRSKSIPNTIKFSTDFLSFVRDFRIATEWSSIKSNRIHKIQSPVQNFYTCIVFYENCTRTTKKL